MLTALWPGKYCSLLRRPREQGLHECYISGGGATAAVSAGPVSGPGLQHSGIGHEFHAKSESKALSSSVCTVAVRDITIPPS